MKLTCRVICIEDLGRNVLTRFKSPQKNFYLFLFFFIEQDDKLEFPEAVQSGAPHQAAATGLHHPHPAVDLRSVF